MSVETNDDFEDLYELSPMQQGMLFHTLYTPGSGVYIEQIIYHLRGSVNTAALFTAWQKVIQQHAVLRTVYAWEGLDQPVQAVARSVELPWVEHDWRGMSTSEQHALLDELLAADRTKGFDLAQPPLLRLLLLRLSDDDCYLVWTYHHILLDGWSAALVIQEVLSVYGVLRSGREPALVSRRPYRDYIAWLRRQNLAEAEAHWRSRLRGLTAPTPLPAGGLAPLPDSASGMPLPSRQSAEQNGAEAPEAVLSSNTAQDGFLLRGGRPVELQGFTLSEYATSALQAFARRHRLTLNTVIQGAWALLLSRYSGETDVVFGATAAGRPTDLDGADSMIGLFINTLPVRVQVPEHANTRAWLDELQTQQVEDRQYDYSPLVQVQNWSEVPHDLPLFESLLVFESYPISGLQALDDGELTLHAMHSLAQTNYPLVVIVWPGATINIRLGYETARFAPDTIRSMLEHLRTVLDSIVAAPDAPVGAISCLPEPERQLLMEWSHGARAAIPDMRVHELFTLRAKRAPDAIALVWRDKTMTYAELDRRSNQLASYLRRLGVKAEVPVAVSMERGPELMTALLGILKAGGVYMPVDPGYPSDRRAYMLSDAHASIMLTQQSPAGGAPLPGVRTICLDTEWDHICQEDDTPPPSLLCDDSAAYIIYTSGSTGRPKGVVVAHRSLANHCRAVATYYDLQPDDRVLQFARASFDVALEEILPTWLSGAALVLWPDRLTPSPSELSAFIARERLTVLNLPSSYWHEWVKEVRPATPPFATLRLLVIGSEKVLTTDLMRWQHVAQEGIRWVNGYGPTECTITSLCYEPENTPPADDGVLVPIGRPIANILAYVLDGALRPVPIGITGELYLGGVGVARGYLNLPELTAETFIPDPFADSPGARLYRTGDRVRYLADGSLAFIGRADEQVKVRGFRVELGEIEALLNRHAAVASGVVLAREDAPGDVRLVAYVVAREQSPTLTATLRRYLEGQLPAYMVPSAFVLLQSFPRLTSGKIDRRMLPAPEQVSLTVDSLQDAPRTPVEEILAGIWSSVLRVEHVRRNDHFFKLGGHSLQATQVIARLREAFGFDLPVRAIYDAPTVAKLAAHIEEIRATQAGQPVRAIQRATRDGVLPLSFAQERLWFLDQLEPNGSFYNMPTAISFTGQLDVAALEASLNLVIQRHESLRTTIETSNDGEPIQIIAPTLHVPLPVVEVPSQTAENTARRASVLQLAHKEAQRPFDLAHGPLVRATLLKLHEQEHVLLLTLHHIIADGWSVGILLQELSTCYADLMAGRTTTLPDLPLQYADYAHWQRSQNENDALARGLDYWKERLANAPAMLDLPTDHPRPPAVSYRGAHQSFHIPAELTRRLKALSREEGATLFMVLLAAFQTLLLRYTGQMDIVVGTAVAERTRRETEGVVGLFLNTLALRTDLSGDPPFRDALAHVREVCMGAYTHQDVPFERLVDVLQPERTLSHSPIFQVQFVLQNATFETIELPDLQLRELDIEMGTSKFDLTLFCRETAEGLAGSFEYSTDLFEAATIRRMIGHWETLLSGIVADPSHRLSLLPLLTHDERQQLLEIWSQTESGAMAPSPQEEGLAALIAAQVRRTPAAPALRYPRTHRGTPTHAGEWQTLSYATVQQRASRLAGRLRQVGVGPEVRVGLYLDRGAALVVSLLAVLQAGGAYVPLDPSYPAERLRWVLADAQVGVLLTQAHLLPTLPDVLPQAHAEMAASQPEQSEQPATAGQPEQSGMAGRPSCVVEVVPEEDDADDAGDGDDAGDATEAAEAGTAWGEGDEAVVSGEQVAYVLYTSGSTGRPKGVQVTQRGLVNYLRWCQHAYPLDEGSGAPVHSSVGFDLTVTSLLAPLVTGRCVTLLPEQSSTETIDALRETFASSGRPYSFVKLTPAHLDILGQLEGAGDDEAVTARLSGWAHALIIGGEALHAEQLTTWRRYAPTMRLINEYGPTETVVGCCVYEVRPDDAEQGAVPIGRPIPNTRLFVLDQRLQAVPIGVAGELYIGGIGVARGYLGRPDLTAERFLPDPFTHEPGGRLYRTGDRVRYRPDGNLEYLGRLDHQVKVRGYRVELGEIEATLARYPGMRENVVMVREDVVGDARLVAYVVADDPTDVVSGSNLHAFLEKILPEYMVPSAVIQLDALPLTPNGKVDRRALPAPRPWHGDADGYVAPRTPVEEIIAEIWCQALGIERVGAHDNFFDIGGHSLMAARVVSRVRSVLQVELPLRMLFEAPTIAGLTHLMLSDTSIRTRVEKIALVLTQLAQLSDTEVEEALARKTGSPTSGEAQ